MPSLPSCQAWRLGPAVLSSLGGVACNKTALCCKVLEERQSRWGSLLSLEKVASMKNQLNFGILVDASLKCCISFLASTLKALGT